MATKSNLQLFDALGKLDDAMIRARRRDNVQTAMLAAQLEAVEALVARGMPARVAIATVVAACAKGAS